MRDRNNPQNVQINLVLDKMLLFKFDRYVGLRGRSAMIRELMARLVRSYEQLELEGKLEEGDDNA